MKKIIKNIDIKIIIPIIALIIIAVFAILKNAATYSFLEKIFYGSTGLRLEFVEPKTVFDCKLNLVSKAKEINIYNADKTTKFLAAVEPEISLRPFSFLFKKINIKKLNAKNLTIKVQRDENNKIDLIEALSIKDFEKFKNQKINIITLISNCNDVNLIFTDNYKIKSEARIHLSESNIDISKKHKNLDIHQLGSITTTLNNVSRTADLKVNIQSKYPLADITSKDLKTDISLTNIDFYPLSDIFNKYVTKDANALLGTLNLTVKTDDEQNQILKAQIVDPKIILKDKKTINPYKIIDIKGKINLNKNELQLSNFTVKSNDLDINTDGSILKLFSAKPEIEFNTEFKNTQINNFTYFIPDNTIFYNPKGIPTLKKANFFAVLNGKINIKPIEKEVVGNLKISNVHIPNYPKSFRQNDVNAYFMKDKVRIYTRVYTPVNEHVTIDGISNLDDSLYGEYSVKSTSKIDLKFAQLYLVPVQQIIGFDIGPVPIMDITGLGNIDIKTKGTLKDAQIFGEFNAFNATARLDGLAAKLTNGKAKFIFDNRNIIFKEIKGKIDNADFLLTGTADTKGNVNLNTKLTNAKTHNTLNIFKNSEISKPYKKFVNNIAAVSGNISADINLKGIISDYENKEFLSDLNLSGQLDFKNNSIILNNKLKANGINGTLAFGQSQSGNLSLFVDKSKVETAFNSKTPLEKIINGEIFDFKSEIKSDNFTFSSGLAEFIKINPKIAAISPILSDIDFSIKFNIKSSGKISINNINPENIKNTGYIIGLNNEKNKNIKFKSGLIKIDNDKLIFNNFDTLISGGEIKVKGAITKFLSKTPNGDIDINIKDVIPSKINKLFPKIKVTTSKINSARILFKNNNVKLIGLSALYDETPLFLNAQIKDIYKSKQLEADFSTIFNEKASDTIINPYLTYPLRIKGEIPTKGTFKGTSENYSIDFSAILPKESDIYFSGANLGDTLYRREITSKVRVASNKANIENFALTKYIANQNGKINPIVALKANGEIVQKNNSLNYNNFKVTTQIPINVRILNLIFKKSLLKKGNFECAINLNGNVKTPKVQGKVLFQDLDIPLYSTEINNIKIDISNNSIDGEALAKNKKSDVKINFKAKNKLQPPYIINKLTILSNNLNIEDILNSMSVSDSKTDIAKQDVLVTPDDVIIENGTFEFKDVQYNKIAAQNLKGDFSYKDNIFNLNSIILDIAQGKIEGIGSYSLKTTRLDLKAKLENCNSAILTKDFLNLPDQLFGRMDGSILLSAKHLNTPDGIKTVKSKVEFSVNNGKMPKLGSLEYLLRAGNLIKNGIMGLSLNNLIQVLTPYKTGEFEKISGSLTIEKGEVNDLEIFSKGKNLSLYSFGAYSILENFADIKIYGKLSQNISNALGSLGNASINQFISSIAPKKNKVKDDILQQNLDKIPSIELETVEPRYFTVRVLGDINKDNYIKNFSWAN